MRPTGSANHHIELTSATLSACLSLFVSLVGISLRSRQWYREAAKPQNNVSGRLLDKRLRRVRVFVSNVCGSTTCTQIKVDSVRRSIIECVVGYSPH